MKRNCKIMKKLILFSIVVFAGATVAFAQESVPPADSTVQQPLVEQMQLTQPQPPMPPKDERQMPQEFFDANEEEDRNEFADPQQIRDALRQIKDLQKDIKRVLKKAKRTASFEGEISELNSLSAQLSEFQQKLQGSNIDHETMSEFWDAQLWDVFNVMRIKIELPDDLKRMEKDLKRLDKTMSKVKYIFEGLDMNTVRAAVEETRSVMTQTRNFLNQGEYESAQEQMQEMWDGNVSHPGEMMGIVDQTQRVARAMKSIKSEEVKQEIRDFLQPVIAAANNGDFQEANMMLNEINRDLFRMLEQMKRKKSLDTQMRSRMEQLEQKMMKKVEEEEKKQQNGMAPQSSLMSYQTYRSASVIDNVYYGIANFFGF